jgi:hypothetical protein
MDDFSTIKSAAANRDWEACERMMFRSLFFCSTKTQKNIAAQALSPYAKVWNDKHPNNAIRVFGDAIDEQQELPPFPDNLDPADAEFESALIEFHNGLSRKINHVRHTMHFATAIRSTVLATQINRWICDFPGEYEQWKEGRIVKGPTFLDDQGAAQVAESAWIRIDSLLTKGRQSSPSMIERPSTQAAKVDTLYARWEKSLL